MSANARLKTDGCDARPSCDEQRDERFSERNGRTIGVLAWHWGQMGAGAKFTYEMLAALRDVQGIEPSISAAAGSDLEAFAAEVPDVPIHVVKTFKGRKTTRTGRAAAAVGVLLMPRLARDFRRILHACAPDVVLCTFQSIWDIAALPALRHYPGRFVLVLHDARFHPGDWYPLRPTVLRRQVEAADALIVLSDHVGRAAAELYRFPHNRIWIVPHGAFHFGARREISRPFPHGRALRLLFLGRIVAYKGLQLLLQTYRQMRERGASVSLEIAGDGDMSPYAQALSDLPDVMVINRWLTDADIAASLERADIVVLPYLEASQSGIAAAAQAAALPLVATPVGGLVEQIEERITGIIATGMMPEDLAVAIDSLIADPGLYESCSTGALRHARETLDWSQVAGRVGHILRDVARLPSRRARD